MERVLGLDLGTNSCGWALVDVPTQDGEAGGIVAMGSRVFPAGADIAGSVTTTRAQERRTKRAQRRQIERRSRRRRVLRGEMTRLGLLSDDSAEFDSLMNVDPNVLQSRALGGEQLTLREIGRYVYWIAGRRGFLSLRSGGSTMLDDDPDFVPNRYRLSHFSADTGERIVQGQEDILVEVLRSQQRFYPDLITDQVIFGRRGRLTYPVRPIPRDSFLSGPDSTYLDEFGIHGLVSFQRTVYWDKGRIGYCSLDPKSRQRRAARAERLSQQFTILQTVIHVRVGRDKRPLNTDERRKLAAALAEQKTLSFGRARKILGVDDNDVFNFERGDETGFRGNQVDPPLRKAVGDDIWRSWNDATRDQLVYLLIGDGSEDTIRVQLATRFGLPADTIEALLKVALPSGRMQFSRRTIRRLMPHLEDAENLRAAIAAAGFATPEEARADKRTDMSDVTNPLVRSSLTQLGKVLRELSARFEREDGTAFDLVRIELARDVSNNARTREAISKEQRKNRAQRERAEKFIEEHSTGSETSGDTLRKARLYEEQKGICVYCGKTISPQDLFANRVQVDHILPRSLTLDNSMANVVLVHTEENLDKGDRTLYEWKGGAFRDDVVERARSLGFRRGKVSKLERDHVDPDHIPSSLLVTTGHLTTLARDFVRENTNLDSKKIQVTRGRITAALLYRTGLTKDQSDHRRHAQDAVMVALSSPAIAQRLAIEYKSARDRGAPRGESRGSWEPWIGFRNQVLAAYDDIVTSHKPERKVGGALHEETRYGRVHSPTTAGEHVYARRRPLVAGFTRAQFNQIADPVIKRILEDDLRRREIDPATAAKLTFDPDSPPLFNGQPIKTVRCHANYPGNIVLNPDSEPKTSVSSAGNHVGYLFRNTKKGSWRLQILTRLESYRLRGLNETERRKSFEGENEEFVMTIAVTDTLHIESGPNSGYWTVTSLEKDAGRVIIMPVNSSNKDDQLKKSIAPLAKDGLSKVTITPSGIPRRARD